MTPTALGAWSLGYGLRRGDILAGKFRVEKVIGRGGMGIVVAALHVQLDQMMAIKLPHAAAIRNPRVIHHFLGEARATAKIQSHHVARVFDVDTLDTGMPYLVMEYLQGRDLSTWLAQTGPLPAALAVDFVLQSCDALAEAHALGIVHRDLKPANLFCCAQPNGTWLVKVLDFGISKNVHQPGADWPMSKGQSDTVMGSPHYMSPEQIKSPDCVDLRADIWSLGVLLFELVTGKLPFTGSGVPELSINVATRATPRLTDFIPGAPFALQAVIDRCLQKSREHRFASIAELTAALRPLVTTDSRRRAPRDASVATLCVTALATACRRMHGWLPAWRQSSGSFREQWACVALLTALTALGTLGFLSLF